MAVVTSRQVNLKGLEIMQLIRRSLPTGVNTGGNLLEIVCGAVRFKANLSYKHPAHELARIHYNENNVTLYLNDYILAGLLGPLPAPYFEFCYRRAQAGDKAMAAFLDIFNHRIQCLRYCQKANYIDGLNPVPHMGLVSRLLAATSGAQQLSDPQFKSTLPELRKQIGLASLLQQNRSQVVLEKILSIFLNLRLKITPFIGSWLAIDSSQRMALGQHNCRLGTETLLGKRAWNQQTGIGLNLYLDDARPEEFLPRGPRHAELVKLVLWLTQYRYDIHIHLHCFARQGNLKSILKGGLRLGYTAWLNPVNQQKNQIIQFKIASHGGQYE